HVPRAPHTPQGRLGAFHCSLPLPAKCQPRKTPAHPQGFTRTHAQLTVALPLSALHGIPSRNTTDPQPAGSLHLLCSGWCQRCGRLLPVCNSAPHPREYHQS
ncbi:unnamed protein product, partial [Gulo gulo]